jgi:hypothetical protein
MASFETNKKTDSPHTPYHFDKLPQNNFRNFDCEKETQEMLPVIAAVVYSTVKLVSNEKQ